MESIFKDISGFILFVARRLYRDHCAQVAASLTYTSLLALIPFFIVGFAVLKEFSIFPELVSSLQSVLLQIFTPDVGEEVKQYIQEIVNRGSNLPVWSFLVLLITAVMMLYTVDDMLNRIWRVDYKPRSLSSFLIYLLVVFSGPLLLATSLGISTYLVSQSFHDKSVTGTNWLSSAPWLVTFAGFTAIYRWVPNTHVPMRHAILGGLVAMLLFELAKWGFTQYIKWVPTYNLLYGALAAIPLTLVWLYISWLVVLIGAEVAYCIEVYRGDFRDFDKFARRILGYFFLNGEEEISIEQLAAWGFQGIRRLKSIIDIMQEAGLVRMSDTRTFSLTPSARNMSIDALHAEIKKILKNIQN